MGPYDVQRADRRAKLLAKAGVITLPVVAGMWVTQTGKSPPERSRSGASPMAERCHGNSPDRRRAWGLSEPFPTVHISQTVGERNRS